MEKAAALYELDRKVVLKKNLPDIESCRHLAAFEKMGMLVTKRLMLKPFVGPHIEQESRMEYLDNGKPQEELADSDQGSSGLYPSMIQRGKKIWSNLVRTLNFW